MQPHKAPLEDVLQEQKFSNAREKKRYAVVNHPLLGGVNLRNDFTIMTWGGFA
jgi:hypothetical protein